MNNMGSTTLLHPVFNNLEQVIIFCLVVIMQNNALNSNALEVMGACKYGDYLKSIYGALVTIKLIVVTLYCA